ncbi:eukaryotic translation initiation factor 3, gamma subunit, putative [Paecilomyces variotii No. 5]|uniref:tRNA (adenine(58)-N(1))-methyltransferase non-catalytic subunit TRM6 n=1 Tax=Byssochlamys spectabilis (strain No. 5 / NBRC 109023) TaxID=1356009 RepID=V5GD10_BYSSN|nr:eukaryotic translation initiation factor 3, gamma subunit, putative [Paecilomyces variotii No. 5]
MQSFVRPHEHVALRLPSDQTKVVQLVPNTTISLGKYGSFPANQIVGRPFYLTFEILDQPDEKHGHVLRLVPATELHAEALISEGSGEADGEGDELEPNGDADVNMRTNRETVDDVSSQKLTLAEIEALKKESSGAGREIIAKLLESHSAIDQKTAFSLAKYTLRKRKKYLRRFTILPMDVNLLTEWMLNEKDASKVMELRDELIGLIGCWGNVHHSGDMSLDDAVASKPNGRYLVVDDTGGLVVAAMAERMGILYPPHDDDADLDLETSQQAQGHHPKRQSDRPAPMSASSNTITVLHPYSQPNVSLLKYFGFEQNTPDPSHPLTTHLKTISWLQLVDPNADSIYGSEPEVLSDEALQALKPNKRSSYYRKRNRWARVRAVVDETRAGEFDGLIVATLMNPTSVLKHAVPLLAGGAPVVVYSPNVEPLVELADLYSTARKTAFINIKRELEEKEQESAESAQTPSAGTSSLPDLSTEFPVDPTLLLAPTLQTSRVRQWQVLPGRTHPLMSGRGGAEGYIFHGNRVLPAQAHVEARGHASRKKRKVVTADTSQGVEVQS